MEFSIRKGNYNDLNQLRSVFNEAVSAFDREYYTDNQVEKWLSVLDKPEEWRSRLGQDQYLVAENKRKEMIGFSSLQDTGRIDMLYVKPAAQKNGIATRLLHSICEIADGAALPFIHTEASLASVLFFEKNGFYVNCANAKDLGGVHFTKIHLVKKLWLM